MHFFTEPSKLNTQSSNQAFGVIDDDNYRLGNLFSASSDLKAFAITSGRVLVQEVNGSSTLVNLVLKPDKQPDLDLPKIDYIIYKGIKKNTLINGTEIAASNTNDLTGSIWNSQNKRNEQIEAATGTNPNDSPNANCLGVNYKSTSLAPYLTLDSDALDLAFYNEDTSFQLPIVQAGWEIGTFDKTQFGILVAFEKLAFNHPFQIARELDSIVSITPLGSSPTDAQTFEYNNSKEVVLNYLDDSAFFGSFYFSKLQVYQNNDFTENEGNDIYDNVLTFYSNKNRVYFDIRNDNGQSFDYYTNYGRNIMISFDENVSPSTLDYYRNYWPILTIENNDFASGNTSNKNFINLTLPQGDNAEPLLFYSKVYKNKRKFKKLKYRKKFEKLKVDNSYTEELKFIVPNRDQLSGTNAIAGYYRLVYLKRVEEIVVEHGNYSPQRKHYLDFIFQISTDSLIPFVGTTDLIKYKQINSETYVDSRAEFGIDFIGNYIIAEDNHNITLLVMPDIYNIGFLQKVPLPMSLVGEKVKSSGHFISYLDKKDTSHQVYRKEIVINTNPLNLLIKEENSRSGFSIRKNYSEYAMLIIEKTAFQGIYNTIQSSSLIENYGIWLYIEDEIETVDDNNKPITEYTLGITGLTENAGTIERMEITTTIKCYTYGNN
jgi:hypothetical protein